MPEELLTELFAIIHIAESYHYPVRVQAVTPAGQEIHGEVVHTLPNRETLRRFATDHPPKDDIRWRVRFASE